MLMDDLENEKPPAFKSWSQWYWLVLGVLLLQIIIYYSLTMSFA
jgi:hypothetical protein